MLADALDLHHRLPLLWAQVELLEVPGGKARRVAELTREAVAWFDQTLSDGERYGWPTIERAKTLDSIAEAQDTLDYGATADRAWPR